MLPNRASNERGGAAALFLCLTVGGLTTGAVLPAAAARGGEVVAGAPSALSVTLYRAPYRNSGALPLDDLRGFALVTETRSVRLPAGESHVRFEGVANGIQPESAIVSGLSSGLIEKNQDARLLSPSALQLAAVGKPLELVRRDRKTGLTTRLPVTLEAASGNGVVFKTAQGVEAWKCSGVSESFLYTSADGLTAAPTLSIRVKSPRPVDAEVTLSYLARGFDCFAQYTAELSPDGSKLQLGAWVTLANGNAVGFPNARTQVVAGKVNHDTGDVEPVDPGPQVLARCWPQETTSDLPAPAVRLKSAAAADGMMLMRALAVPAPAALQEVSVTAQRVTQEQLGDLKLYSIPERTTVAARQSKQVRLLDRASIPVSLVYGADVRVGGVDDSAVTTFATRLIRTNNTAANHLGVALPSGRVAVYERAASDWAGSAPLLLAESNVRDLAVDEEVELDAGLSDDVRVTAVVAARGAAAAVHAARATTQDMRVDVSNGRRGAINVELHVRLDEGAQIAGADHPIAAKNGRPLFTFSVPAEATETLRFAVKSR